MNKYIAIAATCLLTACAPTQDQTKEAQRQEQLKRMRGLASAVSASPAQGYGPLLRSAIKPNIVFTGKVEGNKSADVEVRCAPDGTIVGRKILKSSGNAEWDSAVIAALDKTGLLPRDAEGKVPAILVIGFTPYD